MFYYQNSTSIKVTVIRYIKIQTHFVPATNDLNRLLSFCTGYLHFVPVFITNKISIKCKKGWQAKNSLAGWVATAYITQ